MRFYFTLLTSVTVSLDGLFTGAAFRAGGEGKKTRRLILAVALTVGFMCALAFAFAEVLKDFTPHIAEKAGGAAITTVALYGLIKREETSFPLRKRRAITPAAAIVTGIGIGVDGACACAFSALRGEGWEIIAAVTLFHYLFMETGAFLSGGRLLKNAGEKAGPALLLALGIIELIL